MRLISYERVDGSESIGVMVDAVNFVDVCDIDGGLPRTMRALLESPEGLKRAQRAATSTAKLNSITDVKLLPVVTDPHAIWCLALNFRSHIEETKLTTNPNFPHIFLRVAASQVGHLQPLLCPPPEVDRAYDYEGELAAVIGRGGRHIPVDRALEHVAGFSCYNEGSVRHYQTHNRQFGVGKNFESSGSFGPWLMTTDEFGEPSKQRVQTRVNGYLRQDAPLSDLLFSVQQIIHYISTGYTLRPGDVIVVGTPGALPHKPDDEEGCVEHQFGPIKYPGMVHLKPGDNVEVEVTGLGVLRNSVIADQPASYRPA